MGRRLFLVWCRCYCSRWCAWGTPGASSTSGVVERRHLAAVAWRPPSSLDWEVCLAPSLCPIPSTDDACGYAIGSGAVWDGDAYLDRGKP